MDGNLCTFSVFCVGSVVDPSAFGTHMWSVTSSGTCFGRRLRVSRSPLCFSSYICPAPFFALDETEFDIEDSPVMVYGRCVLLPNFRMFLQLRCDLEVMLFVSSGGLPAFSCVSRQNRCVHFLWPS